MKKMMLILWKRSTEYKRDMLFSVVLEVLFGLFKQLALLFLWIPLLSMLISDEKKKSVIALFILLSVYYIFSVVETFMRTRRVKLSVSLTQKIKRRLSRVAMEIDYGEYVKGNLQAELQHADDILNFEFDYSDGIDLLVKLVENAVLCLSSLILVFSFVLSKPQQGLFSTSFEKTVVAQVVLFFILLLFLWFSVSISVKRKRDLQNKMTDLIAQHIEIEKHFSYYRNEIVYRFDLYPLIHAFKFQSLLSTKIKNNAEDNYKFFTSYREMSMKNELVSKFLMIINTVVIFFMVCYKIQTEAIPSVMFLTFFESIRLFFQSIFDSFDLISQFKVNLPYLETIENALNRFSDVEKKEMSKEMRREKIDRNEKSLGWLFDNVSYKYPNSDTYAIKNISFVLDEKDIHVLVGKNGSGKTTLILLLSKFIEPTSGNIYYRGRNLKDWTKKEYLECIDTCFQDSELFPISLKQNMAFDLDITNNQLKEKCSEWGIAMSNVDDWLEQMDITEFNLSGGEKSKLLLLRSILCNKKYLFLDEPSSALDAESETIMYEKIMEQRELGRMILFVSHRLSSSRYSSDILVLDDGELVARGNHEDLMLNCKVYKELWESQKTLYEIN